MLRKNVMPNPVFGQLSETRRNNFDFLRVLLAVMVIASHAKIEGALAFAPTSGEHVVKFLGPGRLALNGFFVISGFLIANSWVHSRGLGDYAKKRFLRIYPGLIAALLFCALIVGPLGGADLATYFHDPQTAKFFAPLVLKQVHTLPGVFTNVTPPGIIDGPVWTIRFEILCYILLAGLGLLGILRRRGLVLALFLVTFALFNAQEFRWLLHSGIQVPYFDGLDDLPRLATFFLAGTTLYVYRDVIPHSRAGLIVSILGLALTYKVAPSLTLPLFGTYILFYVAFSPAIQLHGFARHGDFSYGLYLYAWPVQQLLLQHLGPRFHSAVTAGHGAGRLLLFLPTFAITLGLAFLSWRLIEKPFLRLKSRPVRAERIAEAVVVEAEKVPAAK
jgi:peptidoglycan/LPS O-acetylase OafA/YrhL